MTLSTMRVNQCWPGWKKTHAQYQTSCLSTQQTGPVHQSVRLTPSICRRDTDDASVVMHDSTKNVAVPLPKKTQYVKEYSPSWSGHVPPDEKRVLQLAGRTMMSSQLSRTRNQVAPRDDFKTRLNSGSGSVWWIFCLWYPSTTRIQESV